MKLRPGHTICACGWHGTLGAKTPCPACGRPAIDRMDAVRIAALRAVRERPDAVLERTLRIKLVTVGVLRLAGERPAPSDNRRARAPRRVHVLTESGAAVLATADALEARQEQQGTGAVAWPGSDPVRAPHAVRARYSRAGVTT
jgi:hypothetical protein